MDLTDVLYEKDGVVATITLNRPEVRNAYTSEMFHSLVAAFDAADLDDGVHVVIVTGAGKSFSAGGDLNAMREKRGMFEGGPVALREQYRRGIHSLVRRVCRYEKPIVAAINGAAVGAGLDLACMCDIRVAVERARFGSPFVKLGLVPGDGGAYFLQRIVGFPRALELMLTGRLIDATEAERIGLVNRVVAPEALMTVAREYADQISANAPLAVRLTKSAAYQAYEHGLDVSLNLAATYQGIVQNSQDHFEGVEALLEKRAPRFSGKE